MSDSDAIKPDPRLAALKGSLLAQMSWVLGMDEKDTLITRFSTANMIREQRVAYIGALTKLGFHPVEHKSRTLGPTIRLSGEEAEIMDIAHSIEAAARPPKPA